MIVENCPYLRDPRVRREAATLYSAGYRVSVICPSARIEEALHEFIGGISVYRFRPIAAGLGPLGYCLEYIYAMLAIAMLSLVVLAREGFDVVHVANPPDTMALISATL